MFTILILLLNVSLLAQCQICNLDERLQIRTNTDEYWYSTSLQYYLAFICPQGFLQNDTHCILPDTSEPSCPLLETLNLEYDITRCSSTTRSVCSYEEMCAYPMSQFLATGIGNNEIKLELTIKSGSLYLDVHGIKSLHHIKDNLHCWATKTAIQNGTEFDQMESIQFEQTFPIYTEYVKSQRYTLRPKTSLPQNLNDTYFCLYFKPGKNNLVVSNKINVFELQNDIIINTFVAMETEISINIKAFSSPNISYQLINDISYLSINKHVYKNVIQATNKLKHIAGAQFLADGLEKAFKKIDWSTEHCAPHNDTFNNVLWCQTKLGVTTIPCENPCLDDEGNIVTRRCERNIKIYLDPKWGNTSSSCSKNANLPETTLFLREKKNNLIVTPATLMNISSIIRDTPNITALDLDSIVTVLSNAAEQTDTETLKDAFLDLIDNVLNIHESAFSMAIHLRQNIVNSVHNFVGTIFEYPTNLTYPNVALQIFGPYSKLTTSFDKMLTVESVSAKFPEGLLETFSSERGKFTIAMTVFKNRNIYPEGIVLSDIVDIQIENFYNYLIEPISVFIEQKIEYDEVVCAFWMSGLTTFGNWSTIGIETIRHSNSNVVECQTYRLTSLCLLAKPVNIISEDSFFGLTSTQYCLEDYDASNNVLWCTTSVETTTIPCENPCLDDEGKIITRKCENDYSEDARWSLPYASCSSNTPLTETTNYLLNNKNASVTPEMLITISSLIRNNPDITALDLYYMSTILSNAINQPDIETLTYPYFDAIDAMLNIDKSIFSKAFNSRENLLHSVDQFIEKISKTPAYLRNPNLALRVYRPYSNLTNSFDQVLTIETVAAVLSVEMLQQLLLNSNDKENFTVAMTVFKNRKLFPEGIIASDIVDLIIPNINKSFSEPISIIIENKSKYDQVVCAYWNYGKNTPGKWSTIGIETIPSNDSNIIECKTYHLTSFALLDDSSSEEIIESDQYCSEYSEPNDLVWCKTRAGVRTTPCKNPCLDDEGNIITQKCEADYPEGASWSYSSARCSSNTMFTETTNYLLSNTNTPVLSETLFNISSLITESPNITALDLHSLSTILSNAVNQADIELLKEAYFDTIDNVLNIDDSAFSKVLHSRENILYSVDQFIEKISKVPANLTNPNLSLKIYRPYSNLTDSFDQAVAVDRVAVILPTDMLQQLLVNSNEKENFTVAMTVFKNRKLFPEGTIASDIVNLIIPNTNKSSTQAISIFFELNSNDDQVACAYWNYGKNTPGNWSTTDIETIIKKNSNIVECKTYHLTSFALLEKYDDSQEVIPSNNYCMGDLDTINGVRWCTTSIGTTTTPCEYPCLDDDGCIITRKCENELSTGPTWSDSSARCSANTTLSEITTFLLKVKNDFMGPAALSIISSVIKDTHSITALDLDSISTILSNALNQTDTEILKHAYFDAIDNVLQIDESVFSKAFHSRENILYSLNQFVEKMPQFPGNFSYKNFDLKMYRPYSSLTDTFDQVLTVEGVSAQFSMNMLLKLCLHSRERESFTIAMAVFKNTKLFPEGALASDVAHLIKPNTNISFAHPVRIFIKRKSKIDKVVCAYWNYSNNAIGNWSTIGIETIRSNDSNIVECKTLHLTSVVLLEAPDDKRSKSNQYCMEDVDTINGVVWCKISVGTTTMPCKNPCVDDEGYIITRKCEGDFQTRAKWSHSSGKCKSNITSASTTIFLKKVKNDFLPPATLTIITSVIQNIPNISALDLDLISAILSNAVNQTDTESLKDAFFDAVDNVLNIDESLFSKSLHSRENILYSVNQFVEKISKLPGNISYRNLALKTYRPYSYLTDTFDQILTLESVAAKFPVEMLQKLFLNSHEKENFTIAMTIFKNRKLFPERIIASDIADLIIPNSTTFLHQPISIFIQPNSKYEQVVCAYWNFEKNTPGYWSTTGIETIRNKESNTVECKTNHLSSFALLGIPDTVIEEISTRIYKENLQYIIISAFGCILSVFGIFITLYTAFACKNWYKCRINSLMLSYVVFCEVIMLFTAEIIEITDNACVAFGAMMHYIILIKFLIILVIVKQQSYNAMTNSGNIPQYKLIYTAITFTIPFILVTVSGSEFPGQYNTGNLSVCYPKHEVLIYFFIIPISLIQLIIIAVFGLFWFNITNSITSEAKETSSKVKLAFMLWFVLVLVWLFGILAEILTITWLQIIFVYGFCTLAPLQGFVVFWFTVIADKDAMIFWRTHLALSTSNNGSNPSINLRNFNNNGKMTKQGAIDDESASKSGDSENDTLLSGTNSKTNRITVTLPTHTYIPFVSRVELPIGGPTSD